MAGGESNFTLRALQCSKMSEGGGGRRDGWHGGEECGDVGCDIIGSRLDLTGWVEDGGGAHMASMAMHGIGKRGCGIDYDSCGCSGYCQGVG